MAVSRRTFLRVLGSALVAAAVVPTLPTAPVIAPAATAAPSRFVVGAGMAKLIRQSRANRETMARKMGLVYDVDMIWSDTEVAA